ncbi:isochorismate synthase [Actinomadura pelletieri DSM 43383]|uniref:isochorismate synthase n=1 Tax=Actinomadura pelletieri DSM 43383 TaxID=1120940 RepID=A0A495QM73_9ACTN|nr:isochorismate synthase [Actinomadura pelletieri]RKS73598.1 isochorismate synthase [Actinomadura pelletieri DSM 43383]
MKLAATAQDHLTVHTVPVPDPGDLIARLPHPTALAWIRHGDGIVGWGEAARITLPATPDRFTAATTALRHLFDTADVHDPLTLPGTGPVAFGSFGFDPTTGDSVLIVPRRVLGRRDGTAWLTTIGDTARTPTPATPLHTPTRLHWTDGALPEHAWKHAVTTAVDRIRHGHLGKVVLARDLTAHADTPIDTRVLLHRLARRYPACYTFSCDGLVGATPELLIRRTGDHIESLVLAGTTARGTTTTDDHTRAARLFTSTKDREEHRYAADMVRDALTPLCHHLTIPDEPTLLTLPNLTHLASPVHGRLTADHTVLDVVAALHPTPAVCGTPTTTALDLIRELEGMDRGRYAGPTGWIDARGDGEWGIALRCAHINGTRARLFAGCGIVADSDPTAELAEATTKFRVMQDALHS